MKHFLLSVMCVMSLVASAQGIIVHETNNNQTSFKTTDVTRIEFSENVNETTSSTYATKEELNTEIQDLKNQISELNSTISDLKKLVDYYHPVFENITIDGKEYKLALTGAIDLGLSVKWATMNVGATAPGDYGDYYAWGETETKSFPFDWTTYFDSVNGSSSNFDKYATNKKTQLDPEDDVAHVKWGRDWRMPTKAEQDELREKCTWVWTTYGGHDGYLIKGSTGNAIFLPAAGEYAYNIYGGVGSHGFYWSSSLDSDYSDGAYILDFYSRNVACASSDRCVSLPVRAVCP